MKQPEIRRPPFSLPGLIIMGWCAAIPIAPKVTFEMPEAERRPTYHLAAVVERGGTR